MTGHHISLFSGVGMTDLAAERAGFRTIATAEVDPFCREVLRTRFPDAFHYDDVRKVSVLDDDLRHRAGHPGPLLVSGGFPCQDVSSAGAGAGLDGARSGLWSEFARVIREFKPDYALIENSPMLRHRGLDVVLADLWRCGYAAKWDCIPAAAVGAPHMRDRIFILAWKEPTPDYQGGPIKFYHVSRTRLPRAGSMHFGEVREETPSAPIRDAKRAILAHAVPCPATPTGAWPTPAASNPQDGEAPSTWLARREKLKAKGINGNGAGMPLSIALKLYPTPRASANEWRTLRGAPTHGRGHGATLAGTINDEERAAGNTIPPTSESAGNVNPTWVEWMMGLPQGWTDPSIPSDALIPHAGWAEEPAGVPRLAAKPPQRKARLRALGNGLVPQAATVALNWKELSNG